MKTKKMWSAMQIYYNGRDDDDYAILGVVSTADRAKELCQKEWTEFRTECDLEDDVEGRNYTLEWQENVVNEGDLVDPRIVDGFDYDDEMLSYRIREVDVELTEPKVRILDLPADTRADVVTFFQENRRYGPMEDEMSLSDVLNAYLSWNGIIGFTNRILGIFSVTK